MSIRIFKHYVQLQIVFLLLLEAGMAVIALRMVVASGAAEIPPPTWADKLIFAGMLTLCAAAMGLYSPRSRARLPGMAVRLGMAAVAAGVVLSLLTAMLPGFEISPLRLVMALVITICGDFLLRFAYLKLLQDDLFQRRVLVYGAGRQAASISNLKRRSDRRGFTIVGFLPADDGAPVVPVSNLVDVSSDLVSFCDENRIDEIVVAMDDRRHAFPVHDLLQCRLQGMQIVELLSFLERETGKVRLDVLNPSWMIFSEGFRRTLPREFMGRLLDIVASLALLAVAWPFMLLTALAIKLEDGPKAPVLYRQRRVGFHGRGFDVLKFRSMRTSAEADGVARWATRDDSRVSRVGSVIRKARIDELPQLFNVLKGDMRFVGPRPERPEFVERLAERIPYFRERHCVKPGLTGWAQLCYPYGASEADSLEKLQYDLYYIKNRSLLFDLAILVQTVEVVLLGKGAR
jgi:sugar transferase (PEP-CTERM system associated)